jgi:hypothetical protein
MALANLSLFALQDYEITKAVEGRFDLVNIAQRE